MPPKPTKRRSSDDSAPAPASASAASKKKSRPNSSAPQSGPASASAGVKTAADKKKSIVAPRDEKKAALQRQDDEESDGDEGEGWSDLEAEADEAFEDYEDVDEDGEDGMDVDGEDADKTPAQVAKEARDPAAQRESREKQKELKLLRKAKDPVYPLVQALKKSWEKLRRSDLPAVDRTKLMAEMMSAVTGNVADLIFKHDASRIVQCMVKYGNEKQRLLIANELKGKFVELSRSMYGRFITLRFLKYTTAARPSILAEFRGHVSKNIKHMITSYVLESIYADYCNAKERYHMIQELYHPRFRQFKTDEPLSQLVADGKVDKKQVLYNLKQVIDPVIAKGILGDLTLVQRAVLDYLDLASDEEKTALFEALHPELVAFLHTREGAQIAVRALAHATAKDRKTIVKTFKDYVMKIANEEYGHWVLLEWLATVDDTKLTATSVVKEFDMNQIPESKYFRKVLLFVLVGASSRHFAPVVLDQLIPAGKKDAWKRHCEVLDYASGAIVDATRESLVEWLKDADLGTFVVEVVMRAHLDDAARADIIKNVLVPAIAAGERDATLLRNVKSMVQYHEHWAKNQAKAKVKEGMTEDGHKELSERTRATSALVAKTFVEAAGKELLQALATSEGTFVSLALAEGEATKEAVVPMLREVVDEIEQGESKGAALLAKVVKETKV
ncbi:armadillo-type protein [Catenaria anguillulae PL171]|uniref:Armadillo-type protein n=1 Tax=Catenaria anguillulae PL171 TaxID=765915 RepID=A0A1Y2HZ70_9FUNG|nr:armadillo-type protein [Catenaria anguillulae PL171]